MRPAGTACVRPHAIDPQITERLWTLSERLTGCGSRGEAVGPEGRWRTAKALNKQRQAEQRRGAEKSRHEALSCSAFLGSSGVLRFIRSLALTPPSD